MEDILVRFQSFSANLIRDWSLTLGCRNISLSCTPPVLDYIFLLFFAACLTWLQKKKQFSLFCLTWPGFELTILRTRDDNTNLNRIRSHTCSHLHYMSRHGRSEEIPFLSQANDHMYHLITMEIVSHLTVMHATSKGYNPIHHIIIYSWYKVTHMLAAMAKTS